MVCVAYYYGIVAIVVFEVSFTFDEGYSLKRMSFHEAKASSVNSALTHKGLLCFINVKNFATEIISFKALGAECVYKL